MDCKSGSLKQRLHMSLLDQVQVEQIQLSGNGASDKRKFPSLCFLQAHRAVMSRFLCSWAAFVHLWSYVWPFVCVSTWVLLGFVWFGFVVALCGVFWFGLWFQLVGFSLFGLFFLPGFWFASCRAFPLAPARAALAVGLRAGKCSFEELLQRKGKNKQKSAPE